MMHYIGTVIRPPSEADSIILQVTVGCSYNKCTFCGAYKDVFFSIKPTKTILKDLQFAKDNCYRQSRIFLADGDVLSLSQKKLVYLFKQIHHYLPWISRISLYGNARSLRHKSIENLLELKSLGLNRIYMGLESGCNEILRFVKKGETAESMIDAAEKAGDCNIFLSVTVLLGLGMGKKSTHHARKTAETLNQMAPRQIGALTYMPLENTQLGQEVKTGSFKLLQPHEILSELSELISHLDLKHCQFHANHASNYLPLAGRLPKDKHNLLTAIDMSLKGILPIRPEDKRAL